MPVEQLRAEMQNSRSDTSRARVAGQLAWQLKFSDTAEALKLANEELRIGLQYGRPLYQAEAWRIKGFLEVVKGNSADALYMYKRGLAYARQAGSNFLESSCLSLIAGMYQDNGDFDQSLKYYLEGLQVAQKGGGNRMIAVLSNNTASVLADAGRSPELCLRYYQEALDHVIPDSNWSFASMICGNMASEHYRAGRTEQADVFIKRALAFSNRPGVEPYDYATTRSEAGAIYLKSARYKDAEKLLLRALYMLDSLQMPDNLLRPLSSLASLYVQQDQLEKADSFANWLLQASVKQKAKLFTRDAYNVLSELERKRGNFEKALQLYKQYVQWNDSVFNEAKERSIAHAEAQSLLKQRELETKMHVEQEHQENELLRVKNSSLRNEKIIALVACLLFIVLSVFMYQAFVTKKRQNAELQEQKRIIQNQSVEKDTLIREIHHRVKNNLQIVSSLLSLQANSVEDQHALDALRESHNRVKTISLIHQKLYTFDELSAISLEDYIQQLWSHLRTVYNATHIELKTIIIPKGLHLDMETSIPVGLILNELITNAIKYAFGKESVQPRITVTFEDNERETYTLQVADNGTGMPKDFDPANSGSLGFRILMQLARQLQGKIWFSTNEGSVFTLVFPRTMQGKKP